jgi:hypothetical protein
MSLDQWKAAIDASTPAEMRRYRLVPTDEPFKIRYSPPPPAVEAPPPVASTVTITASFEDVRKALEYIPNRDVDYDSWWRVIAAVHSATNGEGLELARAWSAKSSKHSDEFLSIECWPYLRDRENGITARTLFSIAEANGMPQIDENDFDVLEPYAEPPPSPANLARFRVVENDDFIRGEPPKWLVKKVLPQAELGVIYGESTAGKSFIALDLAGALDRGVEWCGQRVQKSRVVIICAEGAADFRNRTRAYREFHRCTLGIGVIPDTPNLMERDDVKALEAVLAARGVDLIIVDTFAQTTVGGDENSAKDVGKAIGHCRRLHRATGATVLLVHHAGKNIALGARGSSALKAACDFELEITRNGESRQLRVSKLKGGQDGAIYPFKLTTVPLGIDEDGDEINSCVVEATAAKGTLRVPKGKNQTLVWRIINDLADLGDGPIAVRDVLDAVVDQMPEARDKRGYDRRPDAGRAALRDLQDSKFIALGDGGGMITICQS